MNSLFRVLINIFLTTASWTTGQPTAKPDAGNHLCSFMRSRQRMVQKLYSMSASERPTYYTATQQSGGVPTSKDIIYKPEVTHEAYLAAPLYARPRHDGSQPGASLPDRPRRSRESTSIDHRGVGEQVAVSASQTTNSYSSLSTYPKRMIISRNPSRRYIKSTRKVNRRLGKDVGLFDSKRKGSFSSSASYSDGLLTTHSRNLPYRFRKSTRFFDSETRTSYSNVSSYLGRMLKTSLHSVSTSNEWWRKFTNFETNVDANITDQSVARLTRDRKSKVDLKTDLDNALVNGTVLFVQLNRDTYIEDASTFGYGGGPCNFNNDQDETKAYRYGCKSYSSGRRRRDSGRSDKTTQDYTLESTRGFGDSASDGTTPPQEEDSERQTAMPNITKSITEDESLESFTTKETTEGYTSLSKTTIEADLRGNVSMTKDNLGIVTTPGDDHVDKRTTVKDSPSQQTPGNGGFHQQDISCTDTSDFGEYGIRTFAVSLGIVVLLVYVLGMVLVMRRFLERRRFRAAAHCPHRGSKAAGWLDVVPESFPFDTELEEPITDSRLNLMALNTSLAYDSDPSGDTTREDDSHNVSTFLLRRESQQNAEERAMQGKEEVQHDQVEITTEL